LTLRGRTALVRAAGALLPGSEVTGSARDGSGWTVRIPVAQEWTGELTRAAKRRRTAPQFRQFRHDKTMPTLQ
jgi:hypothetical protein